eukprot:TRINITY_DN4009_c0_g3_i1.p1 TRINITY_DN4009_c0_g3~~TRINITY_DN4009_c0_g3_i1.p1  ORF type:complete len:553 (-),score=130.07 TRINITY_DN4009_c0_g3_i1:55-1713(-)
MGGSPRSSRGSAAQKGAQDDEAWEEPDQMEDVKPQESFKKKKKKKAPETLTEKVLYMLGIEEPDPDDFTGLRLKCHRLITFWGFDVTLGAVIAFNAFTIGLEAQLKATMPVGCEEGCQCKNQVDPTEICYKAPEWLAIAEICFYVVYLIEFMLRIGTYGLALFKSDWIKFDFFLLFTSSLDFIVGAIATSSELKQVMLIRMLRLFRLARAVRMLAAFQTLWKLVVGLFACLTTLVWTFMLITILMYVAAIVGLEFFKADPQQPLDHPYNVAVSDNFANFMDAMLFQLQIFSLDSIGGVYRPLTKHNFVSMAYFVVLILVMSIAFMNLVTAVMVNSSMDQAAADKEVMLKFMNDAKAKQAEELKVMFLELDEDGSGEVSMDEIRSAPEDAQEELQEMAGTDDLEALFNLLDYDGGGSLEVEEFCQGVLKATTCAPGTLELGRLVKQFQEVFKYSKEAVSILSSEDSGGGLGDEQIQALSRIDRKAAKIDSDLGAMHADIARVRQMVQDKVYSRSKSIPGSKTLHSKTWSPTPGSGKRIPDSGPPSKGPPDHLN